MKPKFIALAFVVLFISKIFAKDEAYYPALMYNYFPKNLAEKNWHAVVYGKVIKVENFSKTDVEEASQKLTIKMDTILMDKGFDDEQLNDYSYLIMHGFQNMQAGDKVLLFLVDYDEDYSMPNQYYLKVQNKQDITYQTMLSYISNYYKTKQVHNAYLMNNALLTTLLSTPFNYENQYYSYNSTKK